MKIIDNQVYIFSVKNRNAIRNAGEVGIYQKQKVVLYLFRRKRKTFLILAGEEQRKLKCSRKYNK